MNSPALQHISPFGGAGTQVLRLTKAGNINGALHAYKKLPDSAGAVILINYFSKSNTSSAFEEVQSVYDSFVQAQIVPDEALLSTLINTKRKFGYPEQAVPIIDLFFQFGLPFTRNTFSSLIAACVEANSIDGAIKLHNQISKLGFTPTDSILAQFIKIFCKNSLLDKAMEVLQTMETQNITPTPHIYSSIIACCANTKNLIVGRAVHKRTLGMTQNIILQNSLLNMYFKCGDLTAAEKLFEHSKEIADGITWNVMLMGRAKSSKQAALDTFLLMLKTNVTIERQHITAVFNACSNTTQSLNNPESTDRVMELQYASQLLNILKIYGTRIIFNTLDYAILIKAYCRAGNVATAEAIFFIMQNQKVPANSHICASLLGACTEEHLKLGNFIVEYIHKHNITRDLTLYTAMMNMYFRCNVPQFAFKIWEEIKTNPPIKLDPVLFQVAISVCSACVASESIKHIHSLYNASGFNNVMLETSLINAYACCANLAAAESLFAKMQKNGHDNITWNAMLKAYATLGLGRKALDLFEDMVNKNVEITHVTVCVLLNACSHSGLVKEAQKIFSNSKKKYKITPTIEILNCMVDVFARAGRLVEAEDFIKKHIKSPNHVTWMTYTAGCRILGDIERAKIGVERILQISPNHPATLVLKSNLCASENDFKGAQRTRQYMHQLHIKKEVAHSWIEVNDKLHSFLVQDTTHPETEKIYAEIHKMRALALAAGFKPQTSLVLHDIPDEQKEETLWYHCEKLAVAYGIISTPPGTEIIVKKNLRMCEDCHEAAKYISNIYRRKINVGDAARWHIFENGKCSCNDYF